RDALPISEPRVRGEAVLEVEPLDVGQVGDLDTVDSGAHTFGLDVVVGRDVDVEEQERERGAVALDRGHGPALPFAVRAGPRRDFDLRGREAVEPRVDAL